MAVVLSGFLPLLMTCGSVSADRRLRRLCVGSLAVGFIALLLTFSRTGWLAFFVGAVLVAVYLIKCKKLAMARMRLVVLSLAAIVVILPLGHKIYTRLAKDNYVSAKGRIISGQDALKIIHRYPLMGIELGNSETVISELKPDPCMDVPGRSRLKNGIEPITNAYLEVAAELGIPALVLFLWILMIFLRRGVAAMRLPDKNFAIFVLGLLAGLVTIYVDYMFNPGGISRHWSAVTFLMGGLLMACSRLCKVRMGTGGNETKQRDELG